VPSRVHSVCKNGGAWAARAGPVQPLFDSRRGRIASQSISTAFFVAGAGERAHPISPEGLTPTPFAGLRPLSLNLFLGPGEHPPGVVGGVLAHHVPGGLGQLAGQRLGGHDPVDLKGSVPNILTFCEGFDPASSHLFLRSDSPSAVQRIPGCSRYPMG